MPDLPLDQLKAQHPTCKDCRWWSNLICKKMDLKVNASPDDDGIATDDDDVARTFYTGPNYYCPHYEVKG